MLFCREDRFAKRKSVYGSELQDENLITLAAANPLRNIVEHTCCAVVPNYRPKYEVRFSTTAISMIAAGMGVAVPTGKLQRQLASAVVTTVDLADPHKQATLRCYSAFITVRPPPSTSKRCLSPAPSNEPPRHRVRCMDHVEPPEAEPLMTGPPAVRPPGGSATAGAESACPRANLLQQACTDDCVVSVQKGHFGRRQGIEVGHGVEVDGERQRGSGRTRHHRPPLLPD